MDVEDLFYPLPRNQLLSSVRLCTESNGELEFSNSSSVTLEGFLELLLFFISSMMAGWRHKIFLQKGGVSIGSSVVLILNEICLGGVDRTIKSALSSSTVEKVFQYVHDFLVLNEGDDGCIT